MIRKVSLLILLLSLWMQSQAQTADGLFGADPEPTEWNALNIVLFIVLPILLFVFFLWFRKRKNKK